MWRYDTGLSAINIWPRVFNYGAVIPLNEIYAVVAEIARVQVSVFEVVDFKVPRGCL
jgi:hypothetical protein